MDKAEFSQLFRRICVEAIQQAETAFQQELPKEFLIELHGAGKAGTVMPARDALDLMYINDRAFYLVIDVAVKYIRDNVSILFTRISSHPPEAFDKTWHYASGNGPFNVMLPARIDRQ